MEFSQTPRRVGATLVTHSKLMPGQEEVFARWQQDVTQTLSAWPGFLEQVIMSPSVPTQPYWVSLQSFASHDDASAWLNSTRCLEFSRLASSFLLAPDDVHIVKTGGVAGAPASAVISARVKLGAEQDYRAWQHKITSALSMARGFQSYRFEPPLPNIQDEWLVIIRFDSEVNLAAWLESPERLALVEEAASISEARHAQIVSDGFDQWFPIESDRGRPAAWKMSMLVLLVLYPTVYLFGRFVGTPLLADHGVPSWLAMFVGNALCVMLLSRLVPWAARRFDWWLRPRKVEAPRVDRLGAAIVIGLYALSILAVAFASR